MPLHGLHPPARYTMPQAAAKRPAFDRQAAKKQAQV